MITEYEEVARYRVAEQLRAAEARAQRRDRKPEGNGPRHGLATALRRLAEPQPRHRGTGLSIVR